MFKSDAGHESLSASPSSHHSGPIPPPRTPTGHDFGLAAGSRTAGDRGTAHRLQRLASARRAVVRLPAKAGLWGRDAVSNRVLAGWQPGVGVVVADLTATVEWHEASLSGLLQAQRDLASRRAELRLVVWSPDLYAALRGSAAAKLPVYANLPAALRDH
jgi:hypothetical protein